MPQFPGFPSNDFDFHFEEAGGALAGLLMRDAQGEVIPGVIPTAGDILSPGVGWTVSCRPFVAARSKERAVLLGGTTTQVIIDVPPAPSANARIDVIYSLPADVGAGDPPVGVGIAVGNAGAVPAKPAIPVGAIELGTVRTQAGQSSIAQATLTNTAKFAAVHGSRAIARFKSDLNRLTLPDGATAYCLETGLVHTRFRQKWLGDWLPITMPGWQVHASAGPAARFQEGVVYFRGVVSNANFTGGFTTVGQLPLDIPEPTDSYRTADVAMNNNVGVQKARVSGRNLELFYSAKTGSWANLNSLFYSL